MRSFLFLLYNTDDDFQGISPEEMQGVIEKYEAWGDGLKENGRFISSEKLVDEEGRVLRRANGKTRVIDGPFCETKEVIGGYFAIQAEDYEDAVKIAEDCPHLEYGGMMEIREVDSLH
jgi:hypothetical protein